MSSIYYSLTCYLSYEENINKWGRDPREDKVKAAKTTPIPEANNSFIPH